MDISKSIMKIYRSENRRIPLPEETSLRLWLDRTGMRKQSNDPMPENFRRLGLYAAVAVTAGKGFYENTAGERAALRTGDAILLFPEEGARYGSEGIWSTAWIVWDGAEMEELLRNNYFAPAAPILRQGAAAVLEALRELRILHPTPGAELARKAILLKMFAAFLAPRRHSDPRLDALENPESFFWSLSEAARRCSLSVPHFRRIVHAAFSMSPAHYLLHRKMLQARELFDAGKTVKETAEALGFRNEFHFRRKFKEYFGHPPGLYSRLSAEIQHPSLVKSGTPCYSTEKEKESVHD